MMTCLTVKQFMSVQDAMEMAGDEFGVQVLGQQHDFFGVSLLEDLSEHIHRLALKKPETVYWDRDTWKNNAFCIT